MNPTPTGTLIAVAIFAVISFCTAAYFWSKSEDLKADLAFERFEHDNTRSDLRETQSRADRVVLAVTPLIEKTDWMTGRWGGQFQSLVAMEAKRNTAVETVRKELSSIPHVEALGKQMIAEGTLVPKHTPHFF